MVQDPKFHSAEAEPGYPHYHPSPGSKEFHPWFHTLLAVTMHRQIWISRLGNEWSRLHNPLEYNWKSNCYNPNINIEPWYVKCEDEDYEPAQLRSTPLQ